MRGIVLTIFSTIVFASGCASMCDSSYDCNFHAFGGMRDRIDRTNGRVSSLFDPAAAQPSVLVPQSQLPNYADPLQGTGADDSSDNSSGGGSTDSDLRERLLDELDKLDELPEIPDANRESGTEI